MNLISATVRNYRIHEDLTIEFDPKRTLIGGPNETGKSTLIEAIHRALFLKANVTGQAQASMLSTISGGHPEVELRFAVGDKKYHVTKRFSGQNGTAHLLQVGGETWQGEEAESQLSRLLGVEEVGGGRGILDRVEAQWAHLWVWQGKSGTDPAQAVAAQQSELIEQLQQHGGAVALQSDLDSKVASRFADLRASTFVKSGAPKAGSDLKNASDALNDARRSRDESADRLNRLLGAVKEFEQATDTMRRTEEDLKALREEKSQVEAKIGEANQLVRKLEKQQEAVEGAEKILTDLVETEQKISGLRESIRTTESTLEPQQEALKGLEAKIVSAKDAKESTEKAYDDAAEATRAVRLRRDFYLAHAGYFDRKSRHGELNGRLKRVQTLETQISKHRKEIAELPPIDADRLEALRALENRLANASATLDGMATEIEVVESDLPVRVGEDEIAVESSLTVFDKAEMTVGDRIHIRIHPGGGDSLAEAREEVKRLDGELKSGLDEFGLESISAAVEAVSRRVYLTSKVDKAQSEIDGLDDGDLKESVKVAADQLAGAKADVARRREQVADAQDPATLDEATESLRIQDEELTLAESREENAKVNRTEAQAEWESAEQERTELRDVMKEKQDALTGFNAQLKLLLDNQGDDSARAYAIEKAASAVEHARSVISEMDTALEALQPEQLEQDRVRLERAITGTQQQYQDADHTRAGANALLRSDGSVDPYADLEMAEAQLQAAAEHLEAVSRKAEAIKLIDDLFQQQQHELADQFSQPLAERISVYLQRLYGHEAGAVVEYQENQFQSIQLVRPTHAGALPFDTLSGGTKEQVSAAVRLAIAELLAADHGGSLPIVFDDAFAYSDPDRIGTLQGMLDLGAERGLQVIVLTCNPSDYAALGARQILLN